MKLDEKACGTWITKKTPETNESEIKNEQPSKILDLEVQKKIKKYHSDIDKDTEKVLKMLNELYQIKPTKETYDKLVIVETLLRN